MSVIPAGPGYAAGSAATQDAFLRVKAVLDFYGLGSMSEWAQQKLLDGASEDRIQIELPEQPAFKERFPVIEARRLAGLSAVSPQDIINYEQSWAEIAHSAGLPPSFADRQTAQSMMEANVSVAEGQQRVQQGFTRVAQADQSVHDAWGQWFGSDTPSALAAFFIDPERALPDLERMVTEAEIGGAATRQGFGIRQDLADQAARAGITGAQAATAFQNLGQTSDLFSPTISESNDLLIGEQGAQAALGLSASAAQQVRQRAAQRHAAYQGGDQAYGTTQGFAGVGQARDTG